MVPPQHGGGTRCPDGVRPGAGVGAGPAGDGPGVADACPALEPPVNCCGTAGGCGGLEAPVDCCGVADGCPELEPAAGCWGTAAGCPALEAAAEDGAFWELLGPPAGDVGWGTISPGGTPGAYDIDCPPALAACDGDAAFCVVLDPAAGDDGCGTITPGGTPGAYEIDCLPALADCDDCPDVDGALCAMFDSLEGADGPGAAGGAADCPMLDPAGCDGAVTHWGVEDPVPTVDSEDVPIEEKPSTKALVCCLKAT
jgi:hypothetical protein